MKPAMEFKLSNSCSQDLADQRILKRQTLNPTTVILICITQLTYHVSDPTALEERDDCIQFAQLVTTHDGVKQVISYHMKRQRPRSLSRLWLLLQIDFLQHCCRIRKKPFPVQKQLPPPGSLIPLPRPYLHHHHPTVPREDQIRWSEK